MMKSGKAFRVLALVLICFTFLLDSCTNDNDPVAPPPQQQQKMVNTPFGMMDASKVFHIEEGYGTRIDNNHVVKVKIATGEVVQVLGELTPSEGNEAGRKLVNNPTSVNDVVVTSNSNVQNYTTFKHFMNVPPAPSPNIETLFIGSRMLVQSPNQCLLMAVLQYGPSAAGGGQYWSACAWQQFLGVVTYGTLQTNIAVGSTVVPNLVYSGSGYDAYFSGGSPIHYITSLTSSNLSLFLAGDPKTAGAYPSQFSVNMTSMDIHAGSTYPTPSWSNPTGTLGEHFKVISTGSPNAQVNLCFYGTPGSLWYPNNTVFPLSLTWSAQPGAVSYEISYYIITGSGSHVNGSGTSSTNSFTFPIAKGQYFGDLISKVRAVYPNGVVSDWSYEFNTQLW